MVGDALARWEPGLSLLLNYRLWKNASIDIFNHTSLQNKRSEFYYQQYHWQLIRLYGRNRRKNEALGKFDAASEFWRMSLEKNLSQYPRLDVIARVARWADRS